MLKKTFYLTIFFITGLVFLFSCGKKTPENVFLPVEFKAFITDRCGNPISDKKFYLSLQEVTNESEEVKTSSSNNQGIVIFNETPTPYLLNFKETSKEGKNLYYSIISKSYPVNITYSFDTPDCFAQKVSFPISATADDSETLNDLKNSQFHAGTIPGAYAEEITDFEPGEKFAVFSDFYPEKNSFSTILLYTIKTKGNPGLFFYYPSITYGGLKPKASEFTIKDSFNFTVEGMLYQKGPEENALGPSTVNLFTTMSIDGRSNPELFFQSTPLRGTYFLLYLPAPDAFGKNSGVVLNVGASVEEKDGNTTRFAESVLKIEPSEVMGLTNIRRDIYLKTPPKETNLEEKDGEYILNISKSISANTLILHLYNSDINWWVFVENPSSDKIKIPYNPYLTLNGKSITADLIYTGLPIEYILKKLPADINNNLQEALLSYSSDTFTSKITGINLSF